MRCVEMASAVVRPVRRSARACRVDWGARVRRLARTCATARGTRVPADRARHPWLAHLALRAGACCPAGWGACFGERRRGVSGAADGQVRRSARACPIARGTRFPADWARHPWLAHLALRAGAYCPAGWGACFGKRRRGVNGGGWAASQVRRSARACPTARETRVPADRARHPWLAHLALRAGAYCPAGWGACFGERRSGRHLLPVSAWLAQHNPTRSLSDDPWRRAEPRR